MSNLVSSHDILTPAERVEGGDDDAAEEDEDPGQQQDVDKEDEHCCGHPAPHTAHVTLVNLENKVMICSVFFRSSLTSTLVAPVAR